MVLNDYFVSRFKKYFNYSYIPNNDRFLELIKEYIGDNCSIIKRDNESIIVAVHFEGGDINIVLSLKPNDKGVLFVSSIL